MIYPQIDRIAMMIQHTLNLRHALPNHQAASMIAAWQLEDARHTLL